MNNTFDIAVIGAGIAGASVAAHLAASRSVCILEMEDRPGFHTTGRSASAYEPNYGPAPMLALARASGVFFREPPVGFADAPLITPRGSLFFEATGQETAAAIFLNEASGLVEISEQEALGYFPILRQGYAKRIFRDGATGDLDVDLIHRGFLKQYKMAGGTLMNEAGAKSIRRKNGKWLITTAKGELITDIIINAAGAWGDVVANMAGVKPVGLTPKRRSIGVIPIDHQGLENWPMVTDVGETFYAKPQSGKLLVSSADETPVEPHDAYGDDMAIAEGIERLMNATTIEVTHLDHSWGGLRTFAPDGSPVVGFDQHTKGFFWLVGQGGYGIQSSPALSRTAATMVMKQPLPEDVLAAGLNINDILPNRLR